MPEDFPDGLAWGNRLSEARFLRNQADYDPYPKPDIDFSDISKKQLQTTSEFLGLAEGYLRGKGCKL